MARIGGGVFNGGLLAAVGWVARRAPAAAQGRGGKTGGGGYRVMKLELVAGERRRPLQLYVSHDGRRLLYDRVYELDDPFRANREKINEENAPARGPAEAPVTIVEYSDYTCGYCRQFFEKMRSEERRV